MRRWRNFQARCHHLASWVANRAFYFGGVKFRETLGIASSNRYIAPLKDADLIEPVDVASLHSPRQVYKLTPKGRKALV